MYFLRGLPFDRLIPQRSFQAGNFLTHISFYITSFLQIIYLFCAYKFKNDSWLQTGSGHFSPIGGYHAGKDMVLILDVARFKYPPHWVPLSLLWEAMNTVDEATGHRRG